MTNLSYADSVQQAPIVLGAAQFGSQMPVAESYQLLDAFLEHGGKIIDTAHIYGAWDPQGVNGGYGNSESVIGTWMQERACRDQCVIITKCGHPTFEDAQSCMNQQSVQQHFAESCAHLQTDYIDVYLFHRDDPDQPVEDILEWVASLVQAERVGTIGFSNWSPQRLQAACAYAQEQGIPVAGHQLAWSFAQQREAMTLNKYGEQYAMSADMWQMHHDLQLPAMGYQSQASGFFASQYDNVDFFADDFSKPGLANKFARHPLNLQRREQAVAIAQAHGVSTNQVALAWLLHQPFPVLPLVGSRNTQQLVDSLAATQIALSSQEITALSQGHPW